MSLRNMRRISKRALNPLLSSPRICARAGENSCKGRLTIEHVFIYGGKQIDETWSLLWLCAYHHGVDQYQDCGDLRKELNQFLALMAATDDDLAKYPKKDWTQLKKYLAVKYGTYNRGAGR